MFRLIGKIITHLKYKKIRFCGKLITIIYKDNFSKNVVFYGIPKVIDIEKLVVRDNVRINENVFIHAAAGVTINENSTLSYGSSIISAGYDVSNWTNYLNRAHDSKRIIIGQNVWIGANATVLPGIEICDNVIVAAGAVVCKNIEEEYSIYAGVPARKIQSIRH